MWKAFDAREHRAEVAADYQAAKICEVMVNMQRSSDSNPVELADFLLYDRPEKQGQTAEQMLAMVDMLVDGFHGTRVVN